MIKRKKKHTLTLWIFYKKGTANQFVEYFFFCLFAHWRKIREIERTLIDYNFKFSLIVYSPLFTAKFLPQILLEILMNCSSTLVGNHLEMVSQWKYWSSSPYWIVVTKIIKSLNFAKFEFMKWPKDRAKTVNRTKKVGLQPFKVKMLCIVGLVLDLG